MNTVSCIIDGQEIVCESGTTILEAANGAGISIPTLCYLKGINQPSVCRMCVVEVEGMPKLVPSCVTPVEEQMVIHTGSEKVTASRRRSLDILCRRHRMDCEYCPDYSFCELHARIVELRLDERKYERVYQERRADESSPCIVRDSSRCIRCRRCVSTCLAQGFTAAGSWFSRAGTGFDAQISLAETDCCGCGQCVKNCPTGAVFVKDETDLLWKALYQGKRVIFGIAPESAENIGRFFGEKEERNQMGKLSALCRKIGVERIFDLTGIEGQTIALTAKKAAARLAKGSGPLIVSSCIAVKQHYREDSRLAEVKAAEEVFAEKVTAAYQQKGIPREELFLVMVCACTAGKQRHSSDAVLTTAELFQWIQRACVSRYTAREVWNHTEPEQAERLTGERTNGIPCLQQLRRELQKELQREVNVVSADGISACEKKLSSDAAEVVWGMACPGGCKFGGGQFRTKGYQR